MSASTKTWINNSAPSVEDSDLNGFKNENNNLIVGSGQSLNTGDPQQTHKAVSHYSTVGQFFTGGGIADVYTIAAVAPRVAPPALTDGMVFRAIFPADNTGAATVNPFTLGAVDIKLTGGVNDPAAGQIKAAREAVLIYRTSPSAHAELVEAGMVTTTIVTVSGAYTPPPGVKALRFICTGAGGGAGGVDGQGAGTSALGGGGGSGGTAEKFTTNIEASYTLVIGAKGVGGAAGDNDGTAGGNTTVVSTDVNLTCNGGALAQGMTGTAGASTSNGGDGGTATGGDRNYKGGGGSSSAVVAGDRSALGDGGNSFLGGGQRGRGSAAGADGGAPGAGGSGAGVTDAATNFAGGDGSDGEIQIVEYF